MKFFLIILTLVSFECFSQSKKIASLISELDNSQFTISHEAKATFSMHSKAAHKLIRIGKPATEKLILALSDSTKVIMAQLVLCHIYFNAATFAGPKVITVNNQHVSNYFLGQEKGEGLIISEIKNNNVYTKYIEANDREIIITYWKNKAAKK
ncbi:MAG: hypothetical protein H0U95_18595 [Bacteroidetes bacterium]|nr:hypothetical protein [Bacteroidota bacterium]